MTYEDIARVNEGMTGIDFKGKNYVQVNSRVTAFRKLFPEGFIITDLISNDGGVCVMSAKVGYYDNNGQPFVLSTGMAYEKENSTYINKTSYIENCETSAIGRALGFLALGADDSICSAEELVNAITNQDKQNGQQEMRQFTPPKQSNQSNVSVSTSSTVPPVEKKEEKKAEPTPVQKYLMDSMKMLREERQISAKENNKLFEDQLKALIEAGLAPDKKLNQYTMQEAENLIESMMKNFPINSAELIKK